jgi:hypothetical protein
MANNFKSLQQPFTISDQTTDLLTCSVTSIIVSKVQINVIPSGTGKFHIFLTKSGQGTVKLATKKWASSVDDQVYDLIDKAFVLENGDTITGQTVSSATTVQCTVHYMEKTASVATSNTSDLSDVSTISPNDGQVLVYNASLQKYEPANVSSALGTAVDTGDLPEETVGGGGSEPLNRYMKNIGGLDDLTNTSGSSSAVTLYSEPEKARFVVENNDLSKVQKVSFSDIIAAIIQVGANDIVAAGYADASVFTGPTGVYGDLDGSGNVNTADLLEFLTTFGNTWGVTSSLFSPTLITIQDTSGTSRTSYTGTEIQMVLPASAYVTVDPGTQSVTVDYDNELVVIESAGSSVPISAWTNMKVQLSGLFGCSVFTAGDAVTVECRYTLMNPTGGVLSSGVTDIISNKSIDSAGTDSQVTVDLNLNSAVLESTTQITGGWTNADIDKIEFSFYAYTESGLPATFWFQRLDIDMNINTV